MDACSLAQYWGLGEPLARRLAAAINSFEIETGKTVSVISGYRTIAEQLQLIRMGRPAVSPERSTHTTCPASGADIRIGGMVNSQTKDIWGRIVVINGLRWGGGSPRDPQTGIPSDWQHVDLGPRS